MLASIDKEAFLDACRPKAKYFLNQMDPLKQKALTFEASLGSHQFKTIRKYTIATLGYNIFSPVDKVKQLDCNMFEVINVPFRDKHRNRLAHYRPIEKLFKWKLDRLLLEEDPEMDFGAQTDLQSLSCCHIILGGDHGQGAFRMVATLLLISRGGVNVGKIILEVDYLCGFVECKKDTYDVVASTIGKPINDSLKACGNRLVFLHQDQRSYVVWGTDQAQAAVRAGARNLQSIPVELYMVGDLPYQFLCQGREGFSMYWCSFCEWGKSHWATYDGVNKV